HRAAACAGRGGPDDPRVDPRPDRGPGALRRDRADQPPDHRHRNRRAEDPRPDRGPGALRRDRADQPPDHRHRNRRADVAPRSAGRGVRRLRPGRGASGSLGMNELYDWVVAPLEFAFMQRALLVAIVCGIACAVLSCWLTLLGWSLMGDAVSHAVLPGVALSYIVGAPFAVAAFIFGAGGVALIGGPGRTSNIKEDAAIGIVFTGLFAVGLVLVSVVPSQIDLFHILFGNVLGVSNSDILWALVIGFVVLTALLVKRRDLVLYAFDPTHAHAIGIS